MTLHQSKNAARRQREVRTLHAHPRVKLSLPQEQEFPCVTVGIHPLRIIYKLHNKFKNYSILNMYKNMIRKNICVRLLNQKLLNFF